MTASGSARPPAKRPCCSFCQKQEAVPLVSGTRGAFICESCAQLAIKIFFATFAQDNDLTGKKIAFSPTSESKP